MESYLLEDLELPVVLKNKELMAPGRWNNILYSIEEIKKAFENTDWNDKHVRSLFLDHPVDESKAAGDWVGWIKNPRLESGKVFGDLELWDNATAIKLAKAKAKFGISPRLKGPVEEGSQKDFTFQSFSIVTVPAVKTAYINLSKKSTGGKMVDETLEEEGVDEEIEDIENKEELAKKKKDEDEEKEEAKKYPYPGPHKYPSFYPKKGQKKKYPWQEPKLSEELTDEEFLEVTTNSAWTDFVAKMKKAHPDMPFSEIAKAFKKEKKASEELEGLSEDDLIDQITTRMSILARKKKYPYPEEEKEKAKIAEMEKSINELKEKINEPDPQTVNLSSSPKVDVYKGMDAFLKEITGTGKGITVSLK